MTYSQPSELSDQAFDAEIDKAHAALERQEAEARQIADRIARIPGLEAFARRRRGYGSTDAINPWVGAGHLTAQGAIQRHDPALAAYLANRAGKALAAPDYARQEAEAKRAAQVTRMAEAAEQLKTRNAKHRRALERHATYGSWNPAAGRVI